MSQDIRSFFTVLSKKPGKGHTIEPKEAVIKDKDIKETQHKSSSKTKRRAQVLSSDSEDDTKSSKKDKTPPKKLKQTQAEPKIKPLNIDDILNQPIKQSKVELVFKPNTDRAEKPKTHQNKTNKTKIKKKTELGIHGDKDFEKTLLELDEDSDDTIFLDNLDVLDKTIEEAMKDENISKKTKSVETPKSKKNITPKKRERKVSEGDSTPNKRHKIEHTDSGIDPDQERWEKRRQSAALYQQYLHRGEPKHRGQKEYPKGKADCLNNLTFIKTGVLDSLESEEFENLVKEHGGRVVHAVSKKVNYVVVGDQPGPSKLNKARGYKIPEISEDELLDLILIKSGLKPKYIETCDSADLGLGSSENGSHMSEVDDSDLFNTEIPKTEKNKLKEAEQHESIDVGAKRTGDNKPKLTKTEEPAASDTKTEIKKVVTQKPVKTESKLCNNTTSVCIENMSWTEKYKPTNLKNIIGQQEANSNMNKLKKWLENWFKNQAKKKNSSKPSSYNTDGESFKAALLSGPPGVGKTTTATLVAKELGFDVVEFNASDTRSKKLLHEEISQMMRMKTVAGFVSDEHDINKKRILLMDEVDGMAGNEDRGGIAELINFIKNASFPIICMCNNREHPKMRTLTSYCYGLKFGKPNIQQIKGAMLSICFKEGINIKPDSLAQLIINTGSDIRQTLNHLSMWSAAEKNLSSDTVQKESKNSQKDVVFGPWEVIKKVFNYADNKDMNLAEKSRLFFYDYSLGPLFVQENYIYVKPNCSGPKTQQLKESLIRMSLTADALSMADVIETKIRSSNNWSLLESHGFYSTVLPSYYMSGILGRVNFPGWFGKNSQRNKSLRVISEIYSHARTNISGDKISVRLDYAHPLRDLLIRPMKEKQINGVKDTLEVMKSYSLLRDDLTNLCELLNCFEQPNPFNSIDFRIKGALTRQYNKDMVLSFAPPVASKKKHDQFAEDTYEEDDDSDQETEDNIDNDALIKIKNKVPVKASTSKSVDQKGKGKTKTSGATTSKGKGKK